MSDKSMDERHHGMDLEDHEWLRELGIRALPRGVERVMRHLEEVRELKHNIDRRAELLQSLELDEDTRRELGHEGSGLFQDLLGNAEDKSDEET